MPKPNHPETLDFLLANVCHLHHTRAHQLFESLGLYRGQPPVLQALWEQEGLTQTDLAERLRNTPATTTRMLQRMEKAGFIQRRPDAGDQRVTRVYLTDAGRAVQTQVETIFQTMEAETFANFSPEEKMQISRFLKQIRENLIYATGEKP
jgi:MarR family transcriptional regulator, organic hydroperoxide resistance regulator